MYELEYVVASGYHNLTAMDPPASDAVNGGAVPSQCVLAFSGCELKEDRLKDWLRSCAKQVPEPKCFKNYFIYWVILRFHLLFRLLYTQCNDGPWTYIEKKLSYNFYRNLRRKKTEVEVIWTRQK